MIILFFLFTAIPLVELWLLFRIGTRIGGESTILLVIATGAVGAALARWQGFRAVQRVQNEMRQGMLPAGALGDGFLILAAGLLLITPGVMTDVVGLSLLIPPLRKLVLKGIQRWLANNVRVQTRTFYAEEANAPPPGKTTIIDAKVVDVKSE